MTFDNAAARRPVPISKWLLEAVQPEIVVEYKIARKNSRLSATYQSAGGVVEPKPQNPGGDSHRPGHGGGKLGGCWTAGQQFATAGNIQCEDDLFRVD